MYKWLLVVILWVVGLLNYADRQVIFSVFPPIGRELGASGAQLGLLGTAFLWVYGLMSPFGGYAADRFGRRRVLIASLAVWSAVTFWTGHVHSYGELLAARALMGISEAFYLPAALAMIADYHDDSTRARAVGLHQSGLYAGVLLGGAGGGWFASHFGWRAAFVALGAAGIVYGLVLWPALRDLRGRRSAATGWASLAAIESRPFLIVAGANALTSIAYWCVYTWLPVYLYEDFKMSLAQAGFAATFYIQIASFAGILAGGWLSDRWSRSNRRARLFVQSIGMAAAGPFLFIVGSTGAPWALVAGLVCFGLGRGLYDSNLMPITCQVVPLKLRATAYGVLNCTSCVAGGLMAAGGGYLKDTAGLGVALQFSAVMLLVSGGLLLLVKLPVLAPETPVPEPLPPDSPSLRPA